MALHTRHLGLAGLSTPSTSPSFPPCSCLPLYPLLPPRWETLQPVLVAVATCTGRVCDGRRLAAGLTSGREEPYTTHTPGLGPHPTCLPSHHTHHTTTHTPPHHHYIPPPLARSPRAPLFRTCLHLALPHAPRTPLHRCLPAPPTPRSLARYTACFASACCHTSPAPAACVRARRHLLPTVHSAAAHPHRPALCRAFSAPRAPLIS